MFFFLQCYFDEIKNLLGPVTVVWAGPAAFDSLVRSSVTRPWSARGAGSTPRLVNLYNSNATLDEQIFFRPYCNL